MPSELQFSRFVLFRRGQVAEASYPGQMGARTEGPRLLAVLESCGAVTARPTDSERTPSSSLCRSHIPHCRKGVRLGGSYRRDCIGKKRRKKCADRDK